MIAEYIWLRFQRWLGDSGPQQSISQLCFLKQATVKKNHMYFGRFNQAHDFLTKVMIVQSQPQPGLASEGVRLGIQVNIDLW